MSFSPASVPLATLPFTFSFLDHGFQSPFHPGSFTASDLARTASIIKILWLKFQLHITVRLQRRIFCYGAGVDMYVYIYVHQKNLFL